MKTLIDASFSVHVVFLTMLVHMSRVVRKPAFCICENKDADQLRGNREADQRLCFRYTDSTIPLLPKSEISSLWPSSVAVQAGLCRTWSETPKTGFLRTRLISYCPLTLICLVLCFQCMWFYKDLVTIFDNGWHNSWSGFRYQGDMIQRGTNPE